MLQNQQPSAIEVAGENIPTLVECLPQEEDNWCWAACIQMAALHGQVSKSQCLVVKTAFPHFAADNIDCCAQPRLCDEPCKVKEVDDKFALNALSADFVDGQLTLDRLRQVVLDNQNPRLVGVGWKGSPDHMVLVIGVSATTDTIIVCDPDENYGRGSMSFAELQKPERPTVNWKWRWSWII